LNDPDNLCPSLLIFAFDQINDMATIFHIATREAWDRARVQGSYRPEMFTVEGFIHCSTREQVIGVANFRFRGQTGLVLLRIDTDRVKAEIRYENLEGGQQMFPHIYGELNIDAVARVAEFEPDSEGYFALP
jgi:uncharacterized protein (DUF952 family)